MKKKIVVESKEEYNKLNEQVRNARTDEDYKELRDIFGDNQTIERGFNGIYLPINAKRAIDETGNFMETEKAILIEKSTEENKEEPEYREWIPKSCSIIKEGKVYIQKWLIEKKDLEIEWK